MRGDSTDITHDFIQSAPKRRRTVTAKQATPRYAQQGSSGEQEPRPRRATRNKRVLLDF